MSTSSANHLLPPNSSALEKALSTLAGRIDTLGYQLENLMDPAACPVSFLPCLAWGLSVDGWRADLPEAIKRSMISAALLVHKRKGSAAALKDVMKSLAVHGRITEWWEKSPADPPHTFQLDFFVNDNLGESGEAVFLSSALEAKLRHIVDAVKPIRTHYSLRMGAGFQTSFFIAGSIKSAQFLRLSLMAK